jgi:type I restriction enzyme M protein
MMEEHYRQTLIEFGKRGGMLGIIFRKAQNKIRDPAKLRQLIVELIGKETWTAMSSDVTRRELRPGWWRDGMF